MRVETTSDGNVLEFWPVSLETKWLVISLEDCLFAKDVRVTLVK
jgi:hypothetical protein